MLNFSSLCLRGAVAACSALAYCSPAVAQTVFGTGNYVVVRVGDGSAALTNAATPVFLLEYTPGAVLVRTIALPTANSGTSLALTETGTSGADGFVTRSADARYLVLAGYNAVPGTASLASTTAAATNRLVARIDASSNINTTTRISDAFSGGNIRSAISNDGTSFYAVGNSGGVVYVPLGNTGASTTISTGSPTNDRTIGIAGGNLYVSSGSTPTYGIVQVGSGLPATAGQAQTLLTNVVPSGGTATPASPYGFFFSDQSAAVAGYDVLYVADDGTTSTAGGIQKWSLVNGAWTLNGTIPSTDNIRGLTGNASSAPVVLMATSAGSLYTAIDNAGYNAAPSPTSLGAAVATAPTNTAFRGIAKAPLLTALATRPEATAEQLALFPNPAQDQLAVRLASGSAAGHWVEIRDLLGRVVQGGTVPASGQVSIAALAPGSYLVTLDNALTRRISKL